MNESKQGFWAVFGLLCVVIAMAWIVHGRVAQAELATKEHLLRLELQLPSGLILRSRMTKEEYAALALYDGRKVSIQIRNYRILAKEHEPLGPELTTPEKTSLYIGEGI